MYFGERGMLTDGNRHRLEGRSDGMGVALCLSYGLCSQSVVDLGLGHDETVLTANAAFGRSRLVQDCVCEIAFHPPALTKQYV